MNVDKNSPDGHKNVFDAASSSEASSKASTSLGLWSFPPDILGQILAYKCVSHKVVDLWKCGSRNLQLAMSRSVTIVELCNGRQFLHLGLPFCLTFLGSLRLLSIDRRSPKYARSPLHLTKRDSVLRVLKNLSAMLEELHLNFVDSSSFCIPFCEPSIASLFISSEDIPFSHDIDPYQHSVDLASSYPRLRTLVLDTSGVNDPADLQHLPRHLTSLTVGINHSYPYMNHFGLALPPNLTYFEPTSFEEVAVSFFDSLPSSLVDLNLNMALTEEHIAAVYSAKLPNLAKVYPGMDSSSNRLIPPSTTFLPLSYLGTDLNKWLEKLPPSITQLGCSKFDDSRIGPDQFHLLPPAISTIGYNIHLDGLKSGQLPASLTSIRAITSEEAQIGAQFASFLPPFIVHLRLELSFSTLTGDFFRNLPKTLDRLRLLCKSVEEVPCLPPHLSLFKLQTDKAITGTINPLPESITHLTWNVIGSQFTDLLLFPLRLKVLKLEVFKYPASFDPCDPLLVARARDIHEVGQKEGFLDKSETHILQPSTEKTAVGVMDLLPRTLTYLRFGRYTDVSKVEISEWGLLPKKLKNLQILGDKLSAKALSAALPLNSLTSMELGPCTLLSEHLAMLPDCFCNIDLSPEVIFDFEPELMVLAPPDVRPLDWAFNTGHEAAARTHNKRLIEAFRSLDSEALQQALLPRAQYSKTM